MPDKIHEEGTGAVRSADMAKERWDLPSWAAITYLRDNMNGSLYSVETTELAHSAIDYAGRFLGFHQEGEPVWSYKSMYRNELLYRGWACLAALIQKLDAPAEEIEKLQVILAARPRVAHYPFYALKRLATTCNEGAEKYAEENWLHGFKIKGLLNHAIKHMIRWTNGGSTEDDLGHAMWGFMATTHMLKFRPDMCLLLLGEDYTITEELEAYHTTHKSRREQSADMRPEVVERIKDGRTRAPRVGTVLLPGTADTLERAVRKHERDNSVGARTKAPGRRTSSS